MASKKRRRRDLILQVVQERGSVSVGSLAEMLGVSTQTIRRDLDLLCNGETLRRAHGRLAPAAGSMITDIDQVICDRPLAAAFDQVVDALGDNLVFAEGAE